MQLTEVKVNRIAEALLLPEASSSVLDHFDSAVDALCHAVVGAEQHRVEDIPQVLFQCAPRVAHRFKAVRRHHLGRKCQRYLLLPGRNRPG